MQGINVENDWNNYSKTIGIIGGMGSLATVDLLHKIVTLTDANSDNDHIHILIDNYASIPDRTSYILGHGEDPRKYLIESALKLEVMGADVIIMACNTAHYFYDEIGKYIHVPFINMIEEVAKKIRKINPQIRKVGLLATEGTCITEVYDKVLNKYDIEVIKPNHTNQNIISDLIYSIKKGHKEYNLDDINSVLSFFSVQNINTVILGCTELPVAFQTLNIKGNYIDPTKILAQSVIEFVGKKVIY
ncbi:aspartate/glutamate racemase family protein [Clostridium psychrophilum]|uniref:aspartate/glutamate racemase family protein n=1 Tax=Clostridium psychrophilum TaxID=132926 RepID=UPI001C0CAC9E|nr:amino acid racemase [Clostridium psychrophilum]MBU3181661.1 amino acid racemase [Clostridium psychrophilum]